MKYYITILFALICGLSLQAQDSTQVAEETSEETSESLSIRPLLLIKAQNKFSNQNYAEALQLFSTLSQNDNPSPALLYKAGLCAYHLKYYRNAIQYLQRALLSERQKNINIHYYLGRSYQALGILDTAQMEYHFFQNMVLKPSIESKGIPVLLEQCDYAKSMMEAPEKVVIKPGPENINSTMPEYSPVLLPDGRTLVFTSRRDDSTGRIKDESDHLYLEDIYLAIFDSSSNAWSNPRGLSENVNGYGHDALAGVSPDGTTVFVFRNVHGGDLYLTHPDNDGNWMPLVAFPSTTINTPYFENSASITADGQSLYFVSNRPGGKGLNDIYRSTKTEDGGWNTPENLDSLINTSGDEISCYITPDGTTLYFSSDAHQNMGGYDIFRSTLVDGKFTKAENMGYPINSTSDDIQYFPVPATKTAWFSSVRQSGLGGRDLFIADFNEYKEPSLDVVPEEEVKSPLSLSEALPDLNANNIVLDPTKDQVIERKKVASYLSIRVTDEILQPLPSEISIQTSSSTPLIRKITNAEGKLTYDINDVNFANVHVSANKTGYQVVSSLSEILTDSLLKTPFLQVVVRMKKIATDTLVAINASLDTNKYVVVFDLNSAVIPLSNKHNDKLDQVFVLLKANKRLQVELIGHADITGSPVFNKQLSINRALSAADYLKKQGLSIKRIKTLGKGSKEPIATNETEEGRRTNRRVEIRIY